MKQITITHQDKKYILEFTRATAAHYLRTGYSIDDVLTKPQLALFPFLHAAFKSKQPNIEMKKVEAVYGQIPDNSKSNLVAALLNMFADTYTSLLGDENGSAEGNATWEQNWDGE